jgi:multidrug efflux pump subunit AcrB
VKNDFEEEKIISRISNKPAISFVAIKKESADIIQSIGRIKALIKDERQDLPEGVEILLSDDSSRSVRNRFDIVTTNSLLGLILVTGMLPLFLGLRTTF